jgi:hypothetical protein
MVASTESRWCSDRQALVNGSTQRRRASHPPGVGPRPALHPSQRRINHFVRRSLVPAPQIPLCYQGIPP